MKILVINAGSSSLKYQLFDMTDETVLAKGLCERIGQDGKIKHTAFDGRTYEASYDMPTHSEAFNCLVYALTESDAKVIDSMSEISAVGHRIVQGGYIFSQSTLVDQKVLEDIEMLSELAPLHNKAHAMGIRACLNVLGDKVPQVCVFDTSFHQTMPPKAYIYPVPYEYYEKYKVRRYGFHGTSHRFVSGRAAEFLNKNLADLKMITCHLGNGCSITAIKGGKCIDTSMGFTPLDGIMMGTRSGSLDPSVITYIAEKENISPKEMCDLLNKKSGVLGISKVSNDNRDVSNAAKEGNENAALAIEMQRYQIAKFIGGYVAALNGLDVLVFTGGIGENDPSLREDICQSYLTYLGIKIDREKNLERGKEVEISTADSKVKVLVIPTNEELLIARDTMKIVSAL
ncbi:MAG TPA: acetate kinase [Clostridiales bacterium]|nr:acetate kinase [Clostridiales bacterium]